MLKKFLIILLLSVVLGFLQFRFNLKWIPTAIGAVGLIVMVGTIILFFLMKLYLGKHPEKLEELKRNNHRRNL